MNKQRRKKGSNGQYVLFIILALLIGVAVGYVYGGFMLFQEPNYSNNQTETLDTKEPSETESSKVTHPLEISIDDDPQLGPSGKDAIITIVEFSDYQCPYCKQFFDESFHEILNSYVNNGDVQYVFRDFPLETHKKAIPAAIAANCAGEQDAYWGMHEKLFENQEEWSSTNNNEEQYFEDYAHELLLNVDTFKECLEDTLQKQADEIKHDQDEGTSYEVESTPTFFINGEKLLGAQPIATFKKTIEDQLAKERALKVR